MIIDAHVHMGRLNQFAAEADELVRVADRAGIDRLFVSHFTAITYDMHEGNRAVYEAMQRHPDRFIGYAAIPTPHWGELALAEVKRCVHEYGFRGLKIYSQAGRLGGYETLFSINRPSMVPLVALAADLGLPMLAHCTPEEAVALTAQVPHAKFIMAHTGCQPGANGDWNKAIQWAKPVPNIYLDLTASTIDTGMVEAAVEAVGAERVIFGSDMPLLDPYVQIAKVRAANITEAQKALILGGNIARLIGEA